MKRYGLIGYPLGHSFSKKYFTQKFDNEGITNCRYDLFPLLHGMEIQSFLKDNIQNLSGFNVTIPYKQTIFTFLNKISDEAKAIGAVNCVKIERDKTLTGYNTDAFGFEQSLTSFLPHTNFKALVFGTGGSSKAVTFILKKLKIDFTAVSRTKKKGCLTYEQLSPDLLSTHRLLINTTPLGMSPDEKSCPNLPYHCLTTEHFLYDLVYNPAETLFLEQGRRRGSHTKNGLQMLYQQAEKNWEIWNFEP